MAHGFAALNPGGSFESINYELHALGSDDVEIDVESGGICRSDSSMPSIGADSLIAILGFTYVSIAFTGLGSER